MREQEQQEREPGHKQHEQEGREHEPPPTSCENLSGSRLGQRVSAAWLPRDRVLSDAAPNAREDCLNENDVGRGHYLVDLG